MKSKIEYEIVRNVKALLTFRDGNVVIKLTKYEPDAVCVLRSIPGRSYNKEAKEWLAPAKHWAYAVKEFEKLGIGVDAREFYAT